MTLVVLLRPLTPAVIAVVSTSVVAQIAPAALAQQYVPPYRASTQYGAPYSAPSMAGARRPLDSSFSEPQYGSTSPPIWQGLYLGGNLGYGVGDANPKGVLDTIDISGGMLGAHAGYNWQFRDWVLGLEGDAAWSGVEGTRTFSGPLWVSMQNDWTATLRLRAGYSFNNLLVYATGGLAWGGMDVVTESALGRTSSSESLFGYVVGGGLEMKFTQNLSGRVEALYYGFNEQTMNLGTGNVSVDPSYTTVRAGLTFHFN